jgi:hypothetical protein
VGLLDKIKDVGKKAIGVATGGALGGPVGAAIGGALTDGLFGTYAAGQANDFSAKQFATRYQTTREDLEKAGYNPMLAVAGGNVSGQPTGQAARANLANSAKTAGMLKSELELIDREIDVRSTRAKMQQSQDALYLKQAETADAQREFYAQEAMRSKATTARELAQALQTGNQARISEVEANMWETLGEAGRAAKTFLPSGIVGAIFGRTKSSAKSPSRYTPAPSRSRYSDRFNRPSLRGK